MIACSYACSYIQLHTSVGLMVMKAKLSQRGPEDKAHNLSIAT